MGDANARYKLDWLQHTFRVAMTAWLEQPENLI